jgi:DNA-binding NtrC family response regulator
VPPLRARAEDIPDLVRYFLARIAAEEGKRIRFVSGEALGLLGAYRWPGNVRQLENTVFRAVVLAEGDSIGVAEFPQIAAQLTDSPFAAPPSAPASFGEPLPSATFHEVPPLLEIGPAMAPDFTRGHAAPVPPGTLGLLDAQGEIRPLEEIESEVIRFAIAHYRGQMSEIARRLQIGRSTLYRKLESLGLDEVPGPDTPVAAR